MKVQQIAQVTLLPGMLANRSADAPAGAIHLTIVPSYELEGETFAQPAQDATCTNAELCARAAALVDDLAAWFAKEKGATVRADTRAGAELVRAAGVLEARELEAR